MPPPAQVLAQLPLFANLTLRELGDIIAVLRDGAAAAGHMLICEGAPPGTPLYVLLQGSAATVKRGVDGRPHTVGTVRAPGVFGEIDVLAKRPALAGVVSLEPVVYATLSGDAMTGLCAAACPGILKVLTNLASVLRYRTYLSESRLRACATQAGKAPGLGTLRQLLYGGWDTRRLA